MASPRATLSLSSSPWETPGCAKISAGDLWEVPKKIKHVRVSDNGRGGSVAVFGSSLLGALEFGVPESLCSSRFG